MIKEINKQQLRLQGKGLHLRILKESDINQAYTDGLNNPLVNKYLLLSLPQTHESIAAYIKGNLADSRHFLFGIFLDDDQDPLVGSIRLSDINEHHSYANVGVCLFALRAWKKGYALQAVKMVTDFAFGQLSLHYLEAGAYQKNTDSIKLFETAGFNPRYIVQDKYRLRDQKFEPVIYLGITNPHFKQSN